MFSNKQKERHTVCECMKICKWKQLHGSILSSVVWDLALFQLRKSIFTGTDEIGDVVFGNLFGAKQEDGLNLSFLGES